MTTFWELTAYRVLCLPPISIVLLNHSPTSVRFLLLFPFYGWEWKVVPLYHPLWYHPAVNVLLLSLFTWSQGQFVWVIESSRSDTLWLQVYGAQRLAAFPRLLVLLPLRTQLPCRSKFASLSYRPVFKTASTELSADGHHLLPATSVSHSSHRVFTASSHSHVWLLSQNLFIWTQWTHRITGPSQVFTLSQ